MSQRPLRKPTRWSESEWAHVAAQARSARVPALRFVREAVLGNRAVRQFNGDSAGPVLPVVPVLRPRATTIAADGLVVGLTRMLGSLRGLDTRGTNDWGTHDRECRTLLASAIQAVEPALVETARAELPGAERLSWTVLPYAEALAGMERLAAARGECPPDAALRPLLAAIVLAFEPTP